MKVRRKKFLLDIREMSEEKLRNRLVELQTELARVKSWERRGGALRNPMAIRNLRRNIARIKTVLRERELRRR